MTAPKRKVRTSAARQQEETRLNIAGVGQAAARDHGNEGVFISSDYYRNDIVGKTYPGRVNFATQRVLAYNSTVVKAIITLRAHQIAKLPYTIIPIEKNEPPRQSSILEYSVYNIEHHPAFDEHEVAFLTKVYARLDPKGYISDKKELYEDSDEFTALERATITHLQKKHEDFYKKRARDIRAIKELLSKPDPWFSLTKTWENMLKKVINDILVIDRGVLIKVRDEEGSLKGLMPVDGTCYSDDTEVLTRDGWKNFRDVNVEYDLFATRSPGGKFEWQKATYFHQAPFKGEMINFYSRVLDLLVTPNHRMLLASTEPAVRRGRRRREFFRPAHEVEKMGTQDYGIPRTSTWEGTPVGEQRFQNITLSGDDFCALMGMYLSAGSVDEYNIYIRQTRHSRGFNEYRELTTRLFRHFRHTGQKFVIPARGLANYLRGFSTIPEMVLNATKEQLEIFWRFFFAGPNHSEARGRIKLRVDDKKLADELMEVAQKIGLSATLSKSVSYKLGVVKHLVKTQNTKSNLFHTRRVPYDGEVYCVSVPNESLYVRRKGKPAWCGNTIRPLIDEYGFVDPEKAYVQVINGSPQVYLHQNDVVIFSASPLSDIKYFGYGFSPMETLYTTVLSDIFIDKGNLDYYRKGGSIPEGFISVEPPTSREGMISQINQEQLETIQRHLQAIMMGDYTQVPIVSGGKITWIDFKGKRTDMQFKELAEYLTRKICAVYQVSPQDVGILADVNRATSETQAEMTKSKGLETLMRVVSECVTSDIISELREENDLRLWFEDDDVEKEKVRWGINQQKIFAGVLTINQFRAQEGLHPVPWGNTPLVGLKNWTPGGEGGDVLPELPPLPAVEGEDSPEELMIKGFTKMYEESSNFNHGLYDAQNWDGTSPIDAYEMVARRIGVTLRRGGEVDPVDPLLFSRYVGGGVVEIGSDGRWPLIKSLAHAVIDGLDAEKREKLGGLLPEDSIEEGVELAIAELLSPGVRQRLYNDLLKFQPLRARHEVGRVGECLGFI